MKRKCLFITEVSIYYKGISGKGQGGVPDMTVVDIRNIVTDSSVELISISPATIYYAEEKNEEGHRSLFILEYNRETQRERIVANYFLTNPAFVQHYFDFPDRILIVMENGGSTVWLLSLDKKTGEETALEEIHFVGGYFGCKALDEEHVIFYTQENQRHQELFREYRRATGFSKVACLYDLNEHRYTYIRDRRICGLTPDDLIPYRSGGQTQLLILQPYGSEEEKEHCYQERRWLGDGIRDSVWLCSLKAFLEGVQSGAGVLPLKQLLSAGTDGLLRFAGMDEYNLYFRAKYFPTNDQRICAVSKGTNRKAVVADLNLREHEAPASYYIDTQAAQVFRVEELEDGYHITGTLNSAVDAYYSKELGDFVACIQDRFIVARYVMSDQDDNQVNEQIGDQSEAYTFYSVFDSKTGRQQSYECQCQVKGNTVVLY